MGTVNYTLHHPAGGNAFLVRWASLSTSSGTADSGLPFPSSVDFGFAGSLFSDKCVQVYTFAAASDSRVLIQGSNQAHTVDPAALIWATLTDPQGNALEFRTTGATNPQRMETVLENPWYIRPLVATVTDTSFATQTTTVDLLITSVRSSRSGS